MSSERAASTPHAEHMARALAEAERGHPSPSPRAGAVVAVGERVLGIGHHERAAGPDAVVDALRAAGSAARGATLYATVEPSSPEPLVAAGIARVVIGARDPRAPGAGIAALAAAGIDVTEGILAAEAEERIADLATFVALGRPLTVLKAAATLDGRIATRTGDSKWITGEPARAEGHALRDACDGVLVGVGTVLSDDPRLDVRLVQGRDPVRIVLDTHLRTPPTANVITHESPAPTWIFHGPDAKGGERLAREGVELVPCPARNGALDLAWVLAELGRRSFLRVLVEGGARVHGSLIAAGLADRAVLFLAPLVLADRAARSLAERADPPETVAAATRLERMVVRSVGSDVRIDARFASAKL